MFPGFLHRSATRVSALCLISLLCLIPQSHGQDHSDGENPAPKKHYLTFQFSYRGTAQQTSQDPFRRSERRIDVNTRFTGRIEVRPSEAYDLPTSPEAQMKRAAEIQAAVMSGDVKKLKQATPASLVTWYPVGDHVEITGTVSETSTSNESRTETGESRAGSDRTAESYRGQKVFPGNFSGFVKIRAEEKKYDVQFALMPDMAATWDAVQETTVTDRSQDGNNRHEESSNKVPLDAGPSQLMLGYSNYQIGAEVKGQPLAGEANELIGQAIIPIAKPDGWKGSWEIFLDVSWQIDVTLPPLELVLTAPGYEEWRPEGNIKEPAKIGNSLAVRATLKPKGEEGKFVPRVKHIRFELLDTSREPGVCLNWPLDAKDEDYDLRLAAVSGGTLGNKDQKLEVDDPKRNEAGHAYAEVQVDSYDFGGRASLRAVCLLADGREIEGVMVGEKEMPRLPKMKAPGWIADSWRKANKAGNLADDDDNEKVSGQTNNGDGFTLYEEYRGWVMQGKHVGGDPLKKDFFVRNEIGADAKDGIALFGRVSKLRVLADLRPTEIIVSAISLSAAESAAKGERIMNWNHRDAPHRVDQHGVRLTNTSGYNSRGGAAEPVHDDDKTSRAFRPGKVEYVHVEERGRGDGVYSNKLSIAQYNLSQRDAALVYDRAVAHELLHSVGVDHHGEGESAKMFYFQGAGDPMNTAHRPRFVERSRNTDYDFDGTPGGRPAVWSDFGRGPTITLHWEDTPSEDIAQSLSAEFERELTAERRDPIYEYDGTARAKKYPQFGKDAAFWSEQELYDRVSEGGTKRSFLRDDAVKFDRYVLIGRDHEADSGNELCMMRYYFATAYPVTPGSDREFYLVRPGGNHAGRELCTDPAGTGANAPSHSPRSRFGNAAPGRGGCFQYICPNDAIPPRTL